jgi:lipoyl(octanoyl) transferase
MSNKIIFKEIELIDFKECWDHQEQLFNGILNHKLNNQPTPNYFILCEHPHVYTLGKSGDRNNLLINDEFLEKIEAQYYKINRGGDITYHGPGQLVGYPIIDLENFNLSIRKYIEKLEEVIINVLTNYGIKGDRMPGATGVWLDTQQPGKARKICAIGVRASRSITMHGFAFNVNTDLKYFDYINPCGFTDKSVTSLENEMGKKIEMKEVIQYVRKEFLTIFNS